MAPSGCGASRGSSEVSATVRSAILSANEVSGSVLSPQDPIEEQVVKPQFMEAGPVTMETLQLPSTASSGRNGTCVTSGFT